MMATAPTFADWLLGQMMDHGMMNSSTLAKLVFGTAPDTRGYMVAKSRSQVGHWLRGRHYPTEESRRKLAVIFGVKMTDIPKRFQPRAAQEATRGPRDVMVDMLRRLSPEDRAYVLARFR